MFSLLLLSSLALADEVPLDRWLALQPVPVFAPALADDPALLDTLTPPLDEPWPARGDTFSWFGHTRDWQARTALAEDRPEAPAATVYLTTLSVDRFTEASFSLTSGTAARVWVDGVELLSTPQATPRKEPATAELELVRGEHRVAVVTVATPDTKRWSAKLTATVDDDTTLTVQSTPERRLSLDDLLDTPGVTNLSLSADGLWLAQSSRDPDVSGPGVRHATLLQHTTDPARSLRHDSGLSGLSWAPTGHTFAALDRSGDDVRVLVGTPTGGTRVVHTAEALSGLTWVPGEASLILTVPVEHEDDGDGVWRMRSTADRWAGQRDLAHLWQLDLASGLTRQLTAPDAPVQLLDVSPDGQHLLLAAEVYDTAERPFTLTTFTELSLADGSTRVLLASPWLRGLTYTHDGAHLVATGSPMAFDRLGATTPPEVLPNDYDTQIYVLDRDGTGARPRTLAFDRTIDDLRLTARDELVVKAEVGDRVRLFRAPLLDGPFTEVPLPDDVVAEWAIDRTGDTLVATTAAANVPDHVTLIRDGRPSALPALTGARFDQVRFDTVESFDVALEGGDTLVGRVHLPPDYDPAKTYPAIVYYYGGTAPSSRRFGGRYPHTWWAAQGYVVYVPQPSGSTGFGQEWSARHVADWGDQSARDVIAGTEAFLAAYPSVDADRIGCIGASFGGFLTMKLITQTDLFSAAISHAGISLIPSYWGEGWWGHLYSSASAAEAYPWAHPEVYLDRSPLLHADRITTPLLLLHGAADTNVPVGESEQMYTALKVLGKEVEYLKFDGEDHWILDGEKRRLWSQAIVAWFDRQLRDDPAWWDSLVSED